jgi:hypothetical protein
MPAVDVGRRTSGATKVVAAAAAAIGDADIAALIAPLHFPQVKRIGTKKKNIRKKRKLSLKFVYYQIS